MDISWDITELDILKVKNFLAKNENPFVQERRRRNIEKQNIVIDNDQIIKTMMMCLLTSQQRSGPNSIVGQFLQKKPFPITMNKLEYINDTKELIKEILQNNGLKRYLNRISFYFDSNFDKLKKEKWTIINKLNSLIENDSKTEERIVADSLAEKFKGFGPKQSRNFLQTLGLTKYEIPIDSRITNWLNKFGFPVTLSSSPLGDKGYYHFVSDGIQKLCDKAEIYPCLLDAAIFSSFDNGKWTEKNIMF